MKKSLPIFLALFSGLIATAQQHTITNHATAKHPRTNTETARQAPAPAQSASVSLLSEDFSAGLPGTWTVTDNAGNGEVWTYTTVGTAAGQTLNPANSTAANGYMMFDSDNGGPSSPPEDCDLTTPAINCTGNSQIYLSFKELYTEFQSDSAYVSVSNNGVTWTNFYCPDIFLSQDGSTANANFLTINISSVAANMPTVFVRFHYQGDWDYWWLIDDIKVYVPPAVDIATIRTNALHTEYTRLPLSQAANMQLRGIVKNMGGSTIFGATALFEVIDTVTNTVVFTSASSNISSLAPLVANGIVSTSNFTAGLGYYRVRLTVTAAGDADTTNNQLAAARVTDVNDSVFARDNDVNAGELGIGIGPAQGILGMNFFMTASDVLTSVSFFLTDVMVPNPAGSPVYVTLHDQITQTTAPDSVVIASTDTLLITPGLIPPGGAWFTLPVSGGPLLLLQGHHFFGVHEADSTLSLGITDAIYTPSVVWVSWNGIPSPPAVNNWATADAFGFPIIYQIRPNFGSITNSVNDNTIAAFEIYPNPSADHVTVSFAQHAERTIEILDATGRLVFATQNSNTLVQLDLSAVSEGAYFIRVTENNKASIQPVNIVR